MFVQGFKKIFSFLDNSHLYVKTHTTSTHTHAHTHTAYAHTHMHTTHTRTYNHAHTKHTCTHITHTYTHIHMHTHIIHCSLVGMSPSIPTTANMATHYTNPQVLSLSTLSTTVILYQLRSLYIPAHWTTGERQKTLMHSIHHREKK